MEKQENILGTEKIGKLIMKFSIPCIVSLLVNSLYNMVDQIFIGWEVGYLGNGATNVVFPLTMVCLAFALMFGDGAAAYLSLKLGRKEEKEAAKGVGNIVTTASTIAILLGIGTLIFLPQLLNIFGCTDALRTYAINYGRIIAIGLPFMMIGTTLNSIIRSDGSPLYSMISMALGAVLNTILDAIFLFVFHWGVEGAAIATVISQILTFVMNILYIKKFKSVKLEKDDFKPVGKIIRKIIMLGISSLITQMSVVVVIAVQNQLLGRYGEASKFGAEKPIAVLGIVMKISQILNSIILGIAVGSQPILGYNYGAKKFDRVKNTLKIVLMLGLTISSTAFILFQTIPDKLIAIFGSEDGLYVEFACMTFRIYLMLCICNGIQMPSGIFFQAIGKSFKSAILSLSRQIVFLVPSMIILGHFFKLNGVLYAGPVADGIAFILAVSLLTFEVKNLNKQHYKSEALVDDTSTDNKLSKNMVITISREYGSGGRYVGRLIADKLGIKLYDKDFIVKIAEETGLSEEYIEEHEQKRDVLDTLNNGFYSGLSNADELFIKESELIKEVADKESCVIIGRCSNYILRDRENVVKVFIYGNMKDKVDRAIKYYGLNAKNAEKEINKIDKMRANHYKYYTDRDWKDSSNYDMYLNSDNLGVEKTAELICEFVKEKEKSIK